MLSIVVTIVDGGRTLERCLSALASQESPDEVEVIVPYDDSVQGVPAMAAQFPSVQFLAMGALTTERPTSTAAGQHELFDRRRAAGLARATGDLVAILEDRGAPRPDWTTQAIRLHREFPHAAIGGAIENGVDRPLNWAVYFCDFGRYQLPFDAESRPYISDVNICYKRQALDMTRNLWQDRYHETTVHWALVSAGETLFLHPAMVVDQERTNLRLTALLRERRDWGRLFAYTRARELTTAKRGMLAILTPLLPMILIGRIARRQLATQRTLSRFFQVSPIVLLLQCAWSLGEAMGYVTGKA